MKLSKLVRAVGLSLIVAVTALPMSAAPRCSCNYCQQFADPSSVPCNNNGPTNCGAWLAVTLCPAG
ncbi:MAG TPA: hypothetical protein VIW92_01210 [Thermoanaerobaculia bacterium]